MHYTVGKLRTAFTGAHWGAVDERARDIQQSTGESKRSVSTSLDAFTIKQMIRQECIQILQEHCLITNQKPLTKPCDTQCNETKIPQSNVTVIHVHENKSSTATVPEQCSTNNQPARITDDQLQQLVQSLEERSHGPVFSNKLPQKLSQQFESYAELLKENLAAANRKVSFNDANREMNIDVRILKGEEEFPIQMLIDTGAQRSFISQAYYERHLARKIPMKRNFIRLYGVGGNELKTTGEVELDIGIGDEIVRQKFIVAQVKEQAILGFDFCRSHQAEWRWKDKELTLHGKDKCREVHEGQAARVTTGRVITVPPRCEVIVNGIVENATEAATVGLVQPQSTFLEQHGVGVAATLSRRTGNSIAVRLINTTEDVVSVDKNVHMAIFSPVTIIDDVAARSTGEEVNKEEDQEDCEDLIHQFDGGLDELTEEEKSQFRALLMKYRGQFMRTDTVMGQTSLVQHQIHTGQHPPIKQRPRREPLGMQGAVKEELEKMLSKGIIEPSNSAWASPIVLVRKRDGSIRFCIDYRKLNEVTKKDAYPLPRIEDNLDALAGSRLFSTLDLASGYWQVEMDPAHKDKTSFCTKYGLYQFKVMPFGLCNAPGTFERLMETVLRGMQWERAVLYLDDIIIFSSTVQEHMSRLEEIFHRLKKANLTLKPSKCQFFQTEVEFLGHLVNEEGISTDPKKIEAIVNWEVPRRVKDVRAFLGLTGYFFIIL